MRIKFLGAAQEVTGSMHLLELEQGSIVIDCGFFQGRREESRRRNRTVPHEAVAANAVILTHAHIDHSGSLPTLVKSGFAGSIYTTPATRDLCVCMLRDSARIQYADAAYLNRKYADDPTFAVIEPLYDEEDVLRALAQFVSVPYHHPFEPMPGVTVRLLDAGHILGSAQVLLDIEEKGIAHRLVFSGDLGRKGLPIIRDPEYPPGPVDYVVMESTYGNRVHGNIEQMHDELERVIRETMARGGKIIVPAFAVGRTQELIRWEIPRLCRGGIRRFTFPGVLDCPTLDFEEAATACDSLRILIGGQTPNAAECTCRQAFGTPPKLAFVAICFKSTWPKAQPLPAAHARNPPALPGDC